MADILETVMLVCFGCSWPLSVYKNIRARSAKAMSLQFILLIIAGYVAGITAKVLRGNFSYVLVMYIINLVIVSVNVVVYFINRRYDRQAEQNSAEGKEEAMHQDITAKPAAAEEAHTNPTHADVRRALTAFAQMDAIEPTGGVAVFGGESFANIPFAELAESSGMDVAVHNRSIAGLRLAECADALEACVLAIHPEKVFLNLGEADLGGDMDEAMEQYEWLLYTLHNRSRAKLYLTGVMQRSPSAEAFNTRLKALAAEDGCTFIDLAPALESGNAALRAFELMRSDMRLHPITLTEAMQIAGQCGAANAG